MLFVVHQNSTFLLFSSNLNLISNKKKTTNNNKIKKKKLMKKEKKINGVKSQKLLFLKKEHNIPDEVIKCYYACDT